MNAKVCSLCQIFQNILYFLNSTDHPSSTRVLLRLVFHWIGWLWDTIFTVIPWETIWIYVLVRIFSFYNNHIQKFIFLQEKKKIQWLAFVQYVLCFTFVAIIWHEYELFESDFCLMGFFGYRTMKCLDFGYYFLSFRTIS